MLEFLLTSLVEMELLKKLDPSGEAESTQNIKRSQMYANLKRENVLT